VVATANHYIFDIAAGLMVRALGYVAGPQAARAARAFARGAGSGRATEIAFSTPRIQPMQTPGAGRGPLG
jgi:hypothetical protein